MLEVQRSTVYSFDAVGNVIIIGDRIVWRTNVNYRCCSWNNDIMAWQLKQLNVAKVSSVTLLTCELQVSAYHQGFSEINNQSFWTSSSDVQIILLWSINALKNHNTMELWWRPCFCNGFKFAHTGSCNLERLARFVFQASRTWHLGAIPQSPGLRFATSTKITLPSRNFPCIPSMALLASSSTA